MELAERVVDDATSIGDDDLRPLRDLGLSDVEIMDVVLAAAARCFFSKTLDALGVLPDASYQRARSRCSGGCSWSAGRSQTTRNKSKRRDMSPVTHVGRVMVPVADQDAAIAFYTDTLGFELAADVPFADGERSGRGRAAGRWDDARPRAAERRVPTGHMTGIALDTTDARAVHAELGAKGVDVDAETMGGDGTVPLLFFFRDQDGNSLMVVESM